MFRSAIRAALALPAPLVDRLTGRSTGARARIGIVALGLILSLNTGCVPGGRLASLDGFALDRLGDREAGESWVAFPMHRWYGTRTGVGKPRAVVACLAGNCRNRLAAAVFELEGETARLAERDLRDPQALLRSLTLADREARDRDETDRRRPRPEMAIEVAPVAIGDLAGFEIALRTTTGPQRSVYGVGAGRRAGGVMLVVLAVGDDPQVVRAAAEQVRAEAL